jgi:DNA-binding LytR/AlgR family response regulator
MTINCIAIDDEPLALGLVCSFIEQTPFLRLSGRFASAAAALDAIHNHDIQLIFLDIQMPDLTGMQLARLVGQTQTQSRPGPKIIFTTAYNQFALEGYKVDALDYLLKPFNYEEFLRAATKGKTWFELLQDTDAPSEDNDYLFLKVEYQLMRIAFDDILYIEGLKDYVKVHLKNEGKEIKPLMSLTSLKNLEDKLPPKRFMRIHRSFIIALDKIDSVTKTSVHIGPAVITIGDQYKDSFREFVNKWIV